MYEASNLGRVKSLSRLVNGAYGSKRFVKEKILKNRVHSNGYYFLNIKNDYGLMKNIKVHQLVAIAFLNHKPNGHKLVVDHINGDRKDNNVLNLRIITQRENVSNKMIRTSSKYTGVSWDKNKNKWRSAIKIKGVTKHLGYFLKEQEASLAYQKALKKL
jgi:hypothetical protein